eukprot:SAG31_NODE_2179_length_6249_cov_15.633984_7_plen_80_part_00
MSVLPACVSAQKGGRVIGVRLYHAAPPTHLALLDIASPPKAVAVGGLAHPQPLLVCRIATHTVVVGRLGDVIVVANATK